MTFLTASAVVPVLRRRPLKHAFRTHLLIPTKPIKQIRVRVNKHIRKDEILA